jgi:hypothetical protein
MSSFRECCIAKYYLRPNDSVVYVVHRSNVAQVALSAFLDVSSLNLAVPQGAAFFSGASPRNGGPVRTLRDTCAGPGDRVFPMRPQGAQLPEKMLPEGQATGHA